MRPFCSTHHRTMRWLDYRNRWICPSAYCKEYALEEGPKKYKKPKPLVTVYKDGREVLRGETWKKRKREVWGRDKGCCVSCGKGVCSPGSGVTPEAETHHKKRRGAAGGFRDDRPENLETLCQFCHRKVTP